MSTDIFSAASGDGSDPALPVVVLCHGTMDRSAGMLRVSRELSRHLGDAATVIRYDRRGYARSASVGPPFALEAQIDDLSTVVDRHAPGRAIDLAFGHSFGGNVVLGLADRHPDLVRRAVLYETPMSWFDWWPNNTAGAAAAASAISDSGDAAEAFMRRLIGNERWERLPESTRDGRRSEGAAMMGELSDLRRVAPWQAERVTCPTLAISGEHGKPHHQSGMRALADLIDGAAHVQLDGAGHGAPNTHPGELAALLVDWLSQPVG